MSKIGKNVEICVSWVGAQLGLIPVNAVVAGPTIYVARGEISPGEWVPGKVAEGFPNAFIPYSGKSHNILNYEVLVHTCIGSYGKGVEWISASEGELPKRAIIGGMSPDGEPLYVARGFVNGEICAGKLYVPHGCAYLAWGDDEHAIKEYDVLCTTKT